MHKFLLLGATLLAVAGNVISAQTDVDDDFMRTVEDSNKSLANHIAIKDAKGVSGDTQELSAMFAQVEAFYATKGDAQDALDITKKSRQLIAEIDKSVAGKDFDSANVKASDLSRACKSCHNFYKKS
jgi:cytochrome c556